MSEKIKLTKSEIAYKNNQISELNLQTEAMNLQIEFLKKELEMDLPNRQKIANINSIKSKVDEARKQVEVIKKQVSDWS
jgi:hypothetical protein